MRVTFKHTGMIEEADIRLDGLTVIAGENDTGKSTVGKLLFSIIKTFNRYERDARVFHMRKIKRLIDEYYFDFRKKNPKPLFHEMGKGFFEELKKDILEMVGSDTSINEIQNSLDDKIENFIEKIFQTFGMRITLDGLSSQSVALIAKKPSNKEIFQDSFDKYMTAVLSGEPANKFAQGSEYCLAGKEGENLLFKIAGKNGRINEISLHDPLYFEDATFIESPVILNMADTIRFSKTEFDMSGELKKKVELLEQGYVPEYIRDLILKLTGQPTRGQSLPGTKIQDIIHGDFYYDKDERDFIFEKGDQTFNGVSIASGIKSLGMIHILCLAGFISPKSLLVIDEPEAHLHPEWQIHFAELMVNLVSQGNYILLTSHSPYLIEALKLYSDRDEVKDRTAFYLAEKVKAKYISSIVEVTNDISPIFDILAEPFDKMELLQ